MISLTVEAKEKQNKTGTGSQILRTNGQLPERLEQGGGPYRWRGLKVANLHPWGCNMQHKEYGQYYSNNFVLGWMVTRLIVNISLCMQMSTHYVVQLKLA